MPVRIRPSGTDDRDARPQLLDEGIGGCRPASVVGHLEDVQSRSVRARQTGGQEPCVDLFLDVPGEQEASLAEAHLQDDRYVVYARAGIGRAKWNGAAQRPVNVHLDAVDGEAITGSHDLGLPPERGHPPTKRRVTGSGTDHPGLDDAADVIPIEEQGQSCDVVLVGMRDHDEIEATIPRRDSRVEQGNQPVGVRAGVDEDSATGRSLEQDRVALTDVEHRHVQPSVGT